MAGAIRKLYGEIFLKDKASKSVRNIDKSLDSAKEKTLGLQKTMAAIGGAMFFKKTLDIVGNMVNLAGGFEQTTVAFDVMLGSAEKSKKMLKDIEDFSLVTPFTPDALTENSKLLLNLGVAADKVMPSLQMLGDVSLGNQDKLNRLSLAFGQIASQGRLMGQDLLQLINAGFNPLQVISKKTGKSVIQLKDEMSKGLISFKMVEEAFKTATSKGGKFHKMMEAMSKTWNGLVSTFQGFKGLIFRKIGKVFTDAFKPVLKIINDFLLSFVKFLQTERGVAILKTSIVALSFAFGVLLVGALWLAVKASSALFISLLPFIAIGAAIAASLTAIFLIVDDIITAFQGGESFALDFWKWMLSIFKILPKKITEIENFIIRTFYDLLNFLGNVGMDIIRALIPIEFFENLISDIIDTFKNLPSKIWNSIKNLGSTIRDWFSGGETNKKPAGRAMGGIVNAGTSYIVGEQGPELFTPGATGGFITPSDKLGNKISIKSLVGSIQITVQNAVEGAEEVKDIILDALNDLATNILPAESGVAIT